MVKSWMTPQVWLTRIWLWFFNKDSTCAWSKMIDPPRYDWPGLDFDFLKDSTCAWSKDDWTPTVWQTRISPRIFLKIQHVHGEKLNDPPGMTDQDLTLIFLKDSTCAWSKDDWPTRYDWPGSDFDFLKDSTCAWSKDDWPTRYDWPGSDFDFF